MEYSIKYIKPITTNNSVLEFEITSNTPIDEITKGTESSINQIFTLHVSPYTMRVVGNYEILDLRGFFQHCKEQPKICKLINKSYKEVSEALSTIKAIPCINVDDIKNPSQI